MLCCSSREGIVHLRRGLRPLYPLDLRCAIREVPFNAGSSQLDLDM
jgi:hypothetical protein